jgi:hypothetical protein
MATVRKLSALALLSVKPGFLVLGVLGVLGIAIVVFAAIYAGDPKRREDAQAVLRTLFGRS